MLKKFRRHQEDIKLLVLSQFLLLLWGKMTPTAINGVKQARWRRRRRSTFVSEWVAEAGWLGFNSKGDAAPGRRSGEAICYHLLILKG